MSELTVITPQALKTYAQALSALADFKRRFGRELDESAIAELYVAEKLGLHFSAQVNQPGFDLQDPTGVRYQVKCRAPGTLNVDFSNFEFDYVVLELISKPKEAMLDLRAWPGEN